MLAVRRRRVGPGLDEEARQARRGAQVQGRLPHVGPGADVGAAPDEDRRQRAVPCVDGAVQGRPHHLVDPDAAAEPEGRGIGVDAAQQPLGPAEGGQVAGVGPGAALD